MKNQQLLWILPFEHFISILNTFLENIFHKVFALFTTIPDGSTTYKLFLYVYVATFHQ